MEFGLALSGGGARGLAHVPMLAAKQSSTMAPGQYGASQLNRVSRIRSGVGRRPSLSITSSFRPRHLPPIILIRDFLEAAILMF